ncbi:Rho binding incomplete domain containing protein [Pandoravirus macleodensis]|uniref:Rho binding incomplete domain containing protein n=1 Tax=Pandoravirus macleodensis TaxID=2107707 RepID=A0A2U7UEY1_9VIRU|nr:Rho binding incomplete domain containing protein [Pandoravirus macleodensis]AVK77003.1 Rho binding incomplete domain containing protein [Pandoravirus macleodensis]
MDDVPSTYRSTAFGAQTSSTDATRARPSDLPSDASTTSAAYGDATYAHDEGVRASHDTYHNNHNNNAASYDTGRTWDGQQRGRLHGNNNNNNNNNIGNNRHSHASYDSSDSDLVLPSTPSSSSMPFFGSDAVPPRLVDASALPPPGTFDEDTGDYHQDIDGGEYGYGYVHGNVHGGAAALVPTNGLAPVDARWLHDPVVAAAEFAGHATAPTTTVPRVPSHANGQQRAKRQRNAHARPAPPSTAYRNTPDTTVALPLASGPLRNDTPQSGGGGGGTVDDSDRQRGKKAPRKRSDERGRHHRTRDDRPVVAIDEPRVGGGNHYTGDGRNDQSDSRGRSMPLPPLFNADGFVVPLARRRRTWQLPVCIAGQAVWVAVSTTRRTLTVSTHDLREARLRVPANDLVCSLPAKRAQLYCSDVVIPVEDPAGGGATAAIRARRFDFYVGRGRFTSRVGLLGGPDRRSLFAHLRLPVDLFAVRLDHPRSSAWMRVRDRPLSDDGGGQEGQEYNRHGHSSRANHRGSNDNDRMARVREQDGRHRRNRRRREDSWLALGAAAEPPEGAVSCALVPAPGDEKGIIAVAAAGLSVGRVRFDFLEPLPAIVHAEVPGLCVPRELYDAIAEQIADASGLFCGGASVERGRRALTRAVSRLPHLSIVLHRDPEKPGGGGRVRLDIPPWAYTLWHRPRPLNDGHGDDRSAGGGDDGGRLQLLVSPLEAPDRDDHQCMVMGAACLSRCVAAFSIDRGRAWFWTDDDDDDSDLRSTSDDDEGNGCRP